MLVGVLATCPEVFVKNCLSQLILGCCPYHVKTSRLIFQSIDFPLKVTVWFLFGGSICPKMVNVSSMSEKKKKKKKMSFSVSILYL